MNIQEIKSFTATFYKLVTPHYLIITIISPILFFSIFKGSDLAQLLAIILSLSFAMLGLNASNQIFDIELDKVNKPNRPLPSKKITIREVVLISSILFFLSLLISYFTNKQFFFLMILYVFFALAYSANPLRLKRFFLSSNFFGSIFHFVIPFLVVYFIFGTEFPKLTFSFLFLITFLIATFKDFEDFEGDSKQGISTIPAKFGVENTLQRIHHLIILVILILGTAALFFLPTFGAVILLQVIFYSLLIFKKFPKGETTKETTHGKIVTIGLLFITISQLSIATYSFYGPII